MSVPVSIACIVGAGIAGLPALAQPLRGADPLAATAETVPASRFHEVPDDRPELTVFRVPGLRPLVAQQISATREVWEGRLLGEADSLAMVIHTSLGPVVVLSAPGLGTVQAVPHRLRDGEVDLRIHRTHGEFPPCLGAEPAPGGGDEAPVGGLAGGCDGSERVDVLIRWTPAAESQAGGEMAIRAIAEASVAISNHVYERSGVPLRMRAVDIGPTGPFDLDAESGLLTKLRDPADGHLDEVHPDRNAFGADLVALLSGQNPSYCGVAYLLGASSTGNSGFSVTVWSCAVGNLTFTHEVGHNQGCCHAPGDGGGCVEGGIQPYSVGYRFTGVSGNQWRSVLAYSPGIRWPRLSSPTVIHDGQPFGTDGPEGADNARTVAETSLQVANFRCTVVAEADPLVQIDSGPIVVPVNGVPATFVAMSAPRAAAGEAVAFEVVAIGDLGAPNETLSLRVGDRDLGVVLGGTGNDCRIAVGWEDLAAEAFNSTFAADGSLTIQIIPSAAVDPACAGSEVEVRVRYRPQPPPIAGDLDGNGLIDGGDLAMLLGAWGPCGGCEADLDGNGVVNGADLAELLALWTP
jgi:hypothetical protein